MNTNIKMPIDNNLITIENESFYLMQFPIGDVSGDGHDKCDYYIVKSKKPIPEVREVHFKSKEVLGFDIGDLCSEYDESSLDKSVVSKLRDIGYDFSAYDDLDSDGVPTGISPEQLMSIWLYSLNYIDPSLHLEIFNVPLVNRYSESDERYMNVPGYGLFE